ncbi:hypothetical protein [Rhizobium phage RHph_X2_26]|nr:hypothetical protein [Rhizobium phage RHph_X2_26]
MTEQRDPYRFFYLKGYEDAKAGKRSRIPHNFKLCYVSGRHDAAAGLRPRYSAE